jgi:hypothetical protein
MSFCKARLWQFATSLCKFLIILFECPFCKPIQTLWFFAACISFGKLVSYEKYGTLRDGFINGAKQGNACCDWFCSRAGIDCKSEPEKSAEAQEEGQSFLGSEKSQ